MTIFHEPFKGIIYLDLETRCPICTARFTIDDFARLAITRCGHVFHQECVSTIPIPFACPICRAAGQSGFFTRLSPEHLATLTPLFFADRNRPPTPPPSPMFPVAGEPVHPRRRLTARDPAWQRDADVAECTSCRRRFDLFHRRHHCRHCGRIICAECSDRSGEYRVCRQRSECRLSVR